jgi:hypothetical protein
VAAVEVSDVSVVGIEVRTTPIVANRACIIQRTIAVAVAAAVLLHGFCRF